ncbi:hypothetical protein TNCV_5049261 [Trichonephila clavipes]|nr:hypothetical protein TNCV_5049261 [Trichonephila clavipes]
MSWKLRKKSSFGMEFKSLVLFRWISGISSNIFPFKGNLNRRNRQTITGLRSSESYLRHQASSSATIQFKKFGAASTLFRQNPVKPLNAPASDRQSSDVEQDDNTFFSSLNSG